MKKESFGKENNQLARICNPYQPTIKLQPLNQTIPKTLNLFLETPENQINYLTLVANGIRRMT
jgi:hypothetical protein